MSTWTTSVDSIKRAEYAGLPVKRELTLAYILSLITALMLAVTAVIGLLYWRVIYPTDELFLSFVPSDAFNLALGLPVLLGSLWLARRGMLIGLLSWPGALFYILYMAIPYLIGVPFNVLFLPYLLLVVLSAYTLIGLLTSIDGEAVRQRFAGFLPARSIAGILIGLAILIIVRQTALIGAALVSQTPVRPLETLSWIADFTVAVPALLVGGIQLWRRKALGYVAGPGLLLGYGLLALSLIPFFVLQARQAASRIDVGGIVVVLVMVAFCFIPFVYFVRGAAADPARRSPDPEGFATHQACDQLSEEHPRG